MIAVDPNVLARFYVDDPGDAEARRQRPLARHVLEAPSIFVPLTVLLELERMLHAFYDFEPPDYVAVVNHLLGLSSVTVESRTAVIAAIDAHAKGAAWRIAVVSCGSLPCRSRRADANGRSSGPSVVSSRTREAIERRASSG